MINIEVLKKAIDKQVEQIQKRLEDVHSDTNGYNLEKYVALRELTTIETLIIDITKQVEDADLINQLQETRQSASGLYLQLRSEEIQKLLDEANNK